MNEALFIEHLETLNNLLGELQGDMESGPADKINDWYDQVLDVIFDFEDSAEDIIDARHGYNAEDLEDEDEIDLSGIFSKTDEEIDIEELGDEEPLDEEPETKDEPEAEDKAEAENKEINVDDMGHIKSVTINISLKP